jgi:DNA helicase IV
VLPGLGETSVLLRTVGKLFPGVADGRAEDRLAEEVKGRAMMAGVVAAAVRDRQADGPAEFEFGGERLRLDGPVVAEAARQARATRLPHNQARPLFQRQIIAALAERYAESARELADRLEADVADVPLLDEAAELLGEDQRAAQVRSAREQAQRVAYAQGVLDIAVGSRDSSEEVLSVGDLLDAGELAARHEAPDYQTMAERAAVDRTWTFGHVIVDETQELSPMAWRLLARRCPATSMTIVGDVARTGGPAGQGPGVRLGAHRRPGRDPSRVAARPQRSLRGDDPQHPAARRPAPGGGARGDSCRPTTRPRGYRA